MRAALSTILFIVIFGIIPILGWPFMQPSEAVRIGVLIITVCLYQIIYPINLKLLYQYLPVFFLFCYLAILTALQFGTSDLFSQIFGGAPFYQGLIFFWAIFLFAILSISLSQRRHIPTILICSATYIALAAILQFILYRFFGIQVPLYVDRVVATLGQPSWYSGFLLVILPIAFSTKSKLYPRYISFIVTLVLMLAIVISASITSILIMIILVMGWCLYVLKTKHKLLAIIGLIYIANLLFYQPFSHFQGKVNKYLDKEITQPFHPKLFDDSYSAEKRSLLWTVGFHIAREKPITGFGLNSIPSAYKNFDYQNYFYYANSSFGPPRLQQLYISSSHNIFLDELIQGGVIQLIFFVILLTSIFLYLPTKVLKLSYLLWVCWMQFQLPGVVHWLLFAYFITATSKHIDNDILISRQ